VNVRIDTTKLSGPSRLKAADSHLSDGDAANGYYNDIATCDPVKIVPASIRRALKQDDPEAWLRNTLGKKYNSRMTGTLFSVCFTTSIGVESGLCRRSS